jgi:hypothetical protein
LSSALGLLPGCCLFFGDILWHEGKPLPTVDGPEDPSLLMGTHGTLVAVDGLEPTMLQVVSLPRLDRRTVPLVGAALTISGPDAEGRVVYLERDHGDRKSWYRLRVVSLGTGGDSLLVQRWGSLNPSSAVALSPTGGQLAFTSSIDRGGYDYTPWMLEVIDIATGNSTQVEGAITQHHPLWFPDARHLAFVEWRDSDRSSITSIVDVQSGERRVLREGRTRAMARGISADGHSVLFGEGDPLCRVDAATNRVLDDQLELPGLLFRSADPTSSWVVVADLGAGKVLYDGLPTTGTEQQLVSGYSQGAKSTIKLCDTRTGAFVTVIPQVWGDVSYGAFEF